MELVSHLTFNLHIVLSIGAFLLICSAGVWASLLAYQHRQLKSHHSSSFVLKLPPIQTMEKSLFRMMWIGMALLSGSLATGFFFAMGPEQVLRSKILLAVFAWIYIGILLLGHHFWGWRGITAVKATLTSVCLIVLAYFGTKLLVL